MILLYLDQNYLSGIVKRKSGFRELEPVLRAAVTRGAIGVPESAAHRLESAPRPDLPLLELVRELSGGLRLPDELGARERGYQRRLARVAADHFPERRRLQSDRLDLEAIALALTRCRLITCDAFMADVVRRTRLDVLCQAELLHRPPQRRRSAVSPARGAGLRPVGRAATQLQPATTDIAAVPEPAADLVGAHSGMARTSP